MTFAMFQRTNSAPIDEVLPTLSEWSNTNYVGVSDLYTIALSTFIRKVRLEGKLSNWSFSDRIRGISSLPFEKVPNWSDGEIFFSGIMEREIFHGQGDREKETYPTDEGQTGYDWPEATVHNHGPMERFRLALVFYGTPFDVMAGDSSNTTLGTQFNATLGANAVGSNKSLRRHFEWLGEFVPRNHRDYTAHTYEGLLWTPVINDSTKFWPVYDNGTDYILHSSLTSDFVFGSDYNPSRKIRFEVGTGDVNNKVFNSGRTPAGITTVSGKAATSGAPIIQSASTLNANNKAVFWTAPFQVESGKWFKIIIDNTSPSVTLLTGINGVAGNGPVQP